MGIKEIIGGSIKEKAKELLFTQENAISGFADFVQPVVNLDKPCVNIVKRSNGASTVTVYTTPSTEDFYLTGFTINGSITGASIEVYINGEALNIVTSLGSYPIVHDFTTPLKLDKNTTIRKVIASATSCDVVIFGYTQSRL